jgi:hypothetical protein
MENIEVLKKDIQLIKNKISECVSNKFTDCFDIEMKIMTELPEQYNDYPWLIKRLSKSNFTDDKWLDKFISSLESVAKGESTLASVELKLGEELKQEYIDPILEKNKNKKQ